jgi:DNA-binding response OmpR family regulator
MSVRTAVASNTLGDATVLVVDDEQSVADAYAAQLAADYETRVVYGGEAALEEIDESVDAVLLDRRMPDIHGDDVLGQLREEGYDCTVIMTTAVDPDLDILALDFDDYLCKPIRRDTLLETLDQQLESRQTQDSRLDEFFQVVSKVEVLEEELPPGDLDDNEEYAALKERANDLGNELADEYDDFDDIVSTFRAINRGT